MSKLDYSLSTPCLPPWITATEPPAKPPSLTAAGRDTQETVFELVFDSILDRIAGETTPIKVILEEDPRKLNFAQFIKWVRKSPARLEAYEEAQSIQAELMMSEVVQIADGAEGQLPEEVNRSVLRIRTRQQLAEKFNKKRYGDVKQLDINTTTTINLRATLEERDARILEMVESVPLIR